MSSLMENIKNRTSVRAFRDDEFWQADKDKIMAYAEKAENPYGIPIEWRILEAKEHGLSSPVLSGTFTWLAGKMKRVPHAEEAFGYSFEDIVLYACENGIGTTIIAGTMNRDAFEKAVDLQPDEVMPCTTPLGYPAKKRGLKELAMRKAIGADKRIELKDFVFVDDFTAPLNPENLNKDQNNSGEKAGESAVNVNFIDINGMRDILEMVRWAPSAVNKQPWRIVFAGEKAHFYKKTSKGFIDPATGWDIQKIDIGIAMKHFELGMKEKGGELQMFIEDPQINTPDGTEYIASYSVVEQ